MKALVHSAMIGIGLGAVSYQVSATDYLVADDPVNGIDIYSVTAGNVQLVPGSPFQVNPFYPPPLAQTPGPAAVVGDILYAVFYGSGVASFSLQNGVPNLLSTAAPIPSFPDGDQATNLPLQFGSRFIILAQAIGGNGGPSDLNIIQNDNGSLKLLGTYSLGENQTHFGLGIIDPTAVQTDAADLTAYVSYVNGNAPMSAGMWKIAPGSGAVGSMTVSNQYVGFNYSVTSAGCQVGASGSLTEDSSGNLSGSGSLNQSGNRCPTVTNANATVTGMVQGSTLTMTTSSTAGSSTVTWQKFVSTLVNQSLWGECGAPTCVAVYDISKVPSSAPNLLATVAGTGVGVNPSTK